MIEELRYPFDSEMILRKQKSLHRRLNSQGGAFLNKRIAVLGGSTTADIVNVLNLFLLNEHIRADFYQSAYNKFYEDALFPPTALQEFSPEIVFVHTSRHNIRQFPSVTDTPRNIDSLLDEEFRHFENVWNSLRERFHCVIIQNNFEYPDYRLLGNADVSDVRGKTNFITRLNLRFAEYAAKHDDFFVHDINYLSARYGLDRWSAPSEWYLYKYALSVQAIPEYTYNLACIIKALCGKNKKFLTLDLDNTLWGGVIGDDGADGIRLGSETAEGEAFLGFQHYLKELNTLGIPLTVISKNETEAALSGLNHPESLLHPKDFVDIKANWEPKSVNLLQTAEELHLLPESVVFIDDNPAEREIIRQNIPDAGLPTLEQPDQYIRAIDHANFFEVTVLSGDDLQRTQMYHENLQRAAAEQSFDDYDDYLRSLEMQAVIRSFDSVAIPRITQLTNKTNQFNLTTRRFTQAEIEQASDEDVTLYGRLSDKFGDNGIVSVIIGEQHGDTLEIILWLMSCRVLKRGLENAMLDVLVHNCLERGIHFIRGIYIPSGKNTMVRDFYQSLGFTSENQEADGRKTFLLSLDNYTNRNLIIQVTEEE